MLLGEITRASNILDFRNSEDVLSRFHSVEISKVDILIQTSGLIGLQRS